MFYSKHPPEAYETEDVPLFFTKDEAKWNLLWLFFSRMDILNDHFPPRDTVATHRATVAWLDDFDTDLWAALTVDLERSNVALREMVTTLPPVRFMEWLLRQPFHELFIFEHVQMKGMQLAVIRAQWLDASAASPPAAEVILADFKKRR